MKASIADLQYRTKDVLHALECGARVFIVSRETTKKQMDRLRRGRYNGL